MCLAAGLVRPRSARHRGGFTLIELLVAISIIAVLIGMLFPALAGARRSAQGAVCLANLRQHGVAWLSYLEDNRFFPFERDPTKDNGHSHIWDWGGVNWYGPEAPISTNRLATGARPLNPYYDLSQVHRSDAPVFHCPADDGLKYGENIPYFTDDDLRGLTEFADPTSVYGVRGSSYMANEWIWVRPGSRNGFGGTVRTNSPNFTNRNGMPDVTDPSRFIVVGDTGPFQAGRMGDDRFQIVVVDGQFLRGSWHYSWWHGYQKGQMAFLDGSARLIDIAPSRGETGKYMWWLNPSKHLVDDGSATQALFGGYTFGWDPRSYGPSGELEGE